MTVQKFAVIVAGGKGLRMNGNIPKQFMILKGIPVLMRTVNAFFNYSSQVKIILVLPKQHQSYWEELVAQYNFSVPHTVVDGGESRFQSVKNGLTTIKTDGLVAVHDGVRPFVSDEVIQLSFEEAYKSNGAVVVVPVKDSIRKISKEGSEAVDRSQYFLVQTPQTFRTSMLKKAYAQNELEIFTDDASVFEHFGYQVSLVKGDYKNIKITTEEDLIIANSFLH